MALSYDGRWLLALDSNAQVAVWDLESAGRPSRVFPGFNYGVYRLLIGPQGKWAAFDALVDEDDENYEIQLWDLKLDNPAASPHILANGDSLTDQMVGLSGLSPDGRWLVLSIGSETRAYDLHAPDLHSSSQLLSEFYDKAVFYARWPVSFHGVLYRFRRQAM